MTAALATVPVPTEVHRRLLTGWAINVAYAHGDKRILVRGTEAELRDDLPHRVERVETRAVGDPTNCTQVRTVWVWPDGGWEFDMTSPDLGAQGVEVPTARGREAIRIRAPRAA